MIDAFCCDIVGQTPLWEVAHVWNLTQAVLRKASHSVEHCLLALCGVVAFTVPSLIVEVGVLGGRSTALPAHLPGMLVTCGVLYVLLLAATISEQCARVPALINAISFGPGTEEARQRTVTYVKHSAAGFYVFGMRLTTATVMKIMYVWCILVLGLLTKLGSAS